MIKANIFKITLENGRVAFNSAIIERNNGSYALIIDTSIKRYRTYQNLFFRLVDGLYKINFTNEKELKVSNTPKIKTKNIDNKNLFDNFIEYKNSVELNVISENFELTPIEIEKNNHFFQLFSTKTDKLLIVDYSNTLLDENLKLIAPVYNINNTIKEFLQEIIIKDYSKATLEIESKEGIDFNNLTLDMFKLLANTSNKLEHIIGKNLFNDRVAIALNNKCIQTIVYIPKSEELRIGLSVANEKFEEINNSNIMIKDDDKFNIASVVTDVFKSSDIDNMKFSFQEKLNDDTSISLVNIDKINFNKEDLKTSIKEFKDKKKIDTLSSEFLIDTYKGIYDEKRTEYIFIDKNTDAKYRKIFMNSKLTNEEKSIKAKLLLFVKKEIKATITFNGNTKNKDIDNIELINE